MAQGDPEELANEPSASGAGEPSDEFSNLDEYGFEDEQDLGEPAETIDEQGRRHIRRAAPEGTEQILEAEAPRHTGLSDRAERWRVRSATGTVLTAFAFGLREVFEPDRNEPAIIMETSGEPPRDLPVEAQLEQLGPRQSTVTVRSYLLGNNAPESEPGKVVVGASDDQDGTNSDARQASDMAPGEEAPATATEGDEEGRE